MPKQFRVPLTGAKLYVSSKKVGRETVPVYGGDPADPVKFDRVIALAMGDLGWEASLVPDSIDPENGTAIVEIEASDEGYQRLQALLDDPTVDLSTLELPIPVTHDPEPPLPEVAVEKLAERVGRTKIQVEQ